MISPACDFNLFSIIISKVLLGWLMRLIHYCSVVLALMHTCLLWELWWLRIVTMGVTHSPLCQILLQIVVRAMTISCLFGPVLLDCCWFPLTSPSSMIILQPELLCEGLWSSSLSLGTSELMDLQCFGLVICTTQQLWPLLQLMPHSLKIETAPGCLCFLVMGQWLAGVEPPLYCVGVNFNENLNILS